MKHKKLNFYCLGIINNTAHRLLTFFIELFYFIETYNRGLPLLESLVHLVSARWRLWSQCCKSKFCHQGLCVQSMGFYFSMKNMLDHKLIKNFTTNSAQKKSYSVFLDYQVDFSSGNLIFMLTSW